MTTKKKRGPVIKTDWVVQVKNQKTGIWVNTMIEAIRKLDAVKAANGRVYVGWEARIVERKWRVVG